MRHFGDFFFFNLESCLVDYSPHDSCFDSLKTSEGREVKSDLKVWIGGSSPCWHPGSLSLSLVWFGSSLVAPRKPELRVRINIPHTPLCCFRGEVHTGEVPARSDKARSGHSWMLPGFPGS